MAVRTVKKVLPYQPKDLSNLVRIHNRAYPADRIGPKYLSNLIQAVSIAGGRTWTVWENENPVGYCWAGPIPGLDDVFDLQGCIDVDKRRQGFGRFLLSEIIEAMKQRGPFQLSHAVPALDTPAARFLISQHFEVEHIEQLLLLKEPDKVLVPLFPHGFSLATYSKATAVKKFRALYDAIFQGLPWYQPYTNDLEVSDELANSADLLFLLHDGKPAGVAWLRLPEKDLGEIEPFGLLPDYQGQGLGRLLLAAAIHKLLNQGAIQIQIGGWESNKPALNLYRQIGFEPANKLYYLAYAV